MASIKSGQHIAIGHTANLRMQRCVGNRQADVRGQDLKELVVVIGEEAGLTVCQHNDPVDLSPNDQGCGDQ
ncbi:hypothetical protein D3C73_1415650 [compost metagenome]